MPEPTPPSSALGRVLREPTFHFFLAAAMLFGVNAMVSRESGVLEIDRSQVEARILIEEMSLGTTLGPEARRAIEEAYIDEQVLVREALSLGLENDERIHGVLAQKMLHVLSGGVIQPTDDELNAYYETNRSRYTMPPTVTLAEVVIETSDRLPQSLIEQFQAGVRPERLVTDFPGSRNVLPNVTLEDLTSIFNHDTAVRVFDADQDSWVGPHISLRGQHWLRVTERTDPSTLSLNTVRDQVRLDWIAGEEEARLAQRVAELRDRYSIVFTGEAEER